MNESYAYPQHEGDDSQSGARRYADRHASRIMNDAHLLGLIEELFRVQGKTAHEVLSILNGSLGLKNDVKYATNLGVIQRVVAKLLPAETRKAIYSVLRGEIFDERSRVNIKRARGEWQTEQGMVVFSDEESAYLFELRAQHEYRKGLKHVRNDKIAAAMNERFGTDKFTRDNCRQHAANQAFHRAKKRNS